VVDRNFVKEKMESDNFENQSHHSNKQKYGDEVSFEEKYFAEPKGKSDHSDENKYNHENISEKSNITKSPPSIVHQIRSGEENLTNQPAINVSSVIISSSFEEEKDGEIRMLTVVLRSTMDKTRDVLRMRRIHGIITSYPGDDRFAIHVFERGHGYLVEFPNFTVGICKELLDKLTHLVGSENIRVESILFQ
jgi:hypothetical protein